MFIRSRFFIGINDVLIAIWRIIKDENKKEKECGLIIYDMSQ